MNEEEFRQIMKDDEKGGSALHKLDDDNAILGLMVIRKYLPKKGIEGAGHEVIYSVDVDEILEAGITKEDAEYLRDINWMIDSDCDCLACFV